MRLPDGATSVWGEVPGAVAGEPPELFVGGGKEGGTPVSLALVGLGAEAVALPLLGVLRASRASSSSRSFISSSWRFRAWGPM